MLFIYYIANTYLIISDVLRAIFLDKGKRRLRYFQEVTKASFREIQECIGSCQVVTQTFVIPSKDIRVHGSRRQALRVQFEISKKVSLSKFQP